MEFGKTVRTIALTGAVLGSSALVGSCSKGQRPSFAPEGSVNVCAIEPDDFIIPKRPQRDPEQPYTQPEEKIYAEAAVSVVDLEPTLQGFRVSNSFEESKDNLNKVFEDADVKFHVGEVPDIDGEDIKDHPKKIDQTLLDISARHIVEKLRYIPKELLKEVYKDGADVYLSTDITHKGSSQSSLLYSSPGERSTIVLSLDPEVQTGDEFLWATSELLADRLCKPSDKSGTSNNYTDPNPKGFHYTGTAGDSTDYYEQDAWKTVVNSSAMVSPSTDFELLVRRLLTGYNYTNLNDCRDREYLYDEDFTNAPLCQKARVVLGEIALLDKASAKQLAVQL